MLRFCCLASGSEANAFFLRTASTRLLIDCGLTKPQLAERLGAIGEDPLLLDGVVISHSHGDHARGLFSFTRRFRAPLYVAPETQAELYEPLREAAPQYELIKLGQIFTVGDIEIAPFRVPHDVHTLGFGIAAGGVHLGFATDLGSIAGTEAESIFPHCNLVFLEANHDPGALAATLWPLKLKQRVRANHLSNDVTCSFISNTLTATTSTLILGHISAYNNDPRLVQAMARRALNGRQTKLVVAAPGKQTEVFTY